MNFSPDYVHMVAAGKDINLNTIYVLMSRLKNIKQNNAKEAENLVHVLVLLMRIPTTRHHLLHHVGPLIIFKILAVMTRPSVNW